MNSSRVWELLDGLGGVADEASVGALDDGLPADDAAALGEAVRALVDDLLERCHVAHDHWGEVSEAVAAAVVASGRETYERVHAHGGVLDPAEWAWQEADALLGLGEPVEDAPTFVLQWLTEDLPDGVSSAWRDGHPTVGTVLEDGSVMDDSPAWGHVPAADPAWEAALEILLVEPSVAHARQAIGDAHGTSYDRVAVWLTLSDTPEPTITVYADDPDDPDGDPQDDPEGREVVLVGTYPAAELRGTDVAQRTVGYAEIVAGLLQVVADDS